MRKPNVSTATPEELSALIAHCQDDALSSLNFNLSDAGNGELIAALFGDRFRHDGPSGRDLLVDGQRWRQDPGNELIQLAKEAARFRYVLAASVSDPDDRKKVAKWAIDSENKGRIESALAMARCEPAISDSGADWDNEPM